MRVGEITRIPEAPAHIRGVFNLRGRILPVVDLRTRLGLPAAALTPRSRLILVEAHGRVLALLCDAVSRMTRVAASLVRPPPAEALSTQVDYVTGVAQVARPPDHPARPGQGAPARPRGCPPGPRRPR